MPDIESVPSPGSFIVYELERRGWSQRELADIMGRPFQMVNEIVKAKRAITTDTAIALGAAFGSGPEIWLHREAAYQVSQANIDTEGVLRRAKLYDLAPIKEMERRGWIKKSANVTEIESELKKFFGSDDLSDTPKISAATRRADDQEELSPSQRAWCFRVRQMGTSFSVPVFNPNGLAQCATELRKIAAYPQETFKVHDTLAKHGIRFVVVEPLAGAKVDGVAMWIDKDSPLIGMSLRYDRNDSFWFTLFHELSHITNGDEAPLDADLTDRMAGVTVVRSEMERRANEEAANALVPHADIQSFIRRIGPLYSKASIIKFANRIKIHPGIVVGQLHRRDEIGYSANREMLSKVRDIVISTAVTDGWGYSPTEGVEK